MSFGYKVREKDNSSVETPISCELTLFSAAQNWKRYWAATVSKYLQGAVLEVGAGIGSNSTYLLTERVVNLTLLEPDEELFSTLGEGVYPERVTCMKGGLSDVDEIFDSIVYIDVLEHIEDDDLETSRAYDHLRSGGNLIVLSPAWQFLFSPFDQAVGHYRRYSRVSLRGKVDPRLQTVSEIYLDSIGLFASLGNRLFLRRSSPTRKQIEMWDRVMVRVSTFIDPLLFHSVGKTVVGVYRKP
jgi:SAM-dependent methyltransferase